MGDIFKRHAAVIAAAVITLIGTIGLGMMVLTTGKKAGKKERELADIMNKKDQVYKFPWALNEANRERARENLNLAVAKYQEKFDEVAKRYPPAKEEQLPAIVCVERIKASCEAMRDRLDRDGVSFSAEVGKFTFGKYLDSPQLPDDAAIPKIMKHLKIIDELVTVVGSSRIRQLITLSRDADKLELQNGTAYLYHEYKIRIQGNFDTVRKFVNALNTARFYFVIREMTVGAEDLTREMKAGAAEAGNPGGGGAKNPGGMGPEFGPPGGQKPPRPQTPAPAAGDGSEQLKESRVAFTRMAAITLDLRLDYIEFVEDNRSVQKRRSP